MSSDMKLWNIRTSWGIAGLKPASVMVAYLKL